MLTNDIIATLRGSRCPLCGEGNQCRAEAGRCSEVAPVVCNHMCAAYTVGWTDGVNHCTKLLEQSQAKLIELSQGMKQVKSPWISPNKGLPLLSDWTRVLVVTDEDTVMTLPSVKVCNWAAKGMIKWWMEIPDPPGGESE